MLLLTSWFILHSSFVFFFNKFNNWYAAIGEQRFLGTQRTDALSCYWWLLPPANEVWGKVIFSEACVKNSVHGGCLLQVHAGMPPPWKQTPPGSSHPPRKQIPPWSRPPWKQTHLPEADTPQEADTPHPWEQTPPPQSMFGDMVNARVVRILLECNLVFFMRSHIVQSATSCRLSCAIGRN